MATSMTVTVHHNPFLDGIKDPARVICDWVSAALGTVSIAICSTLAAANLVRAGANTSAIQPKKIRGKLIKIQTIPGLYGDLATTLPTNLYDVTLLDSYGADIAAGTLVDRSGTVADLPLIPNIPIAIDSELTVTIASAGDTKTGRIILEFDAVDGY